MKSRSNLFIAAAVLGLAVLFGSPAVAADNIFDIVPNDAAGVVIVNRVGETDAKIAKLCDQLQYPVPEQFTRIFSLKDSAAGVDAEGSAALIAMPGEGKFGMDIAVLVVPITDFKQFLTQFTTDNPDDAIIKAKWTKDEMDCLIARKGNFALLAAPDSQDALNTVLNSTQSLTEAVKPWSEWLDKTDVLGIVTHAGLSRISDEAISQMEEAKQFIDNGGKQMEPFQVVLDAAIKQLSSSEKEIKMTSASLVINDTGSVEVYHNLLFEPGGKISEFFESIGENRDNPMAGLSKGPFTIAFSGVVPKQLLEMAADFTDEIIDTWPTSHGLNEKQAECMAKINRKMLTDVRGVSLMFGVPTADMPLADTAHTSLWVEDSQQFVSDYGKEVRMALEAVKKEAGSDDTASDDTASDDADSDETVAFESSDDPSMAKVSVRDVTAGGVKAVELTIDFSKLLSEQADSQQAQLVKMLYGETGITTTYIAAADPNTILFVHGGEEALTAAVNAVNDANASLAGDQGIMEANKKLLPGGQWVGFWSPSGVVNSINSAFEKFGQNGAQHQLPQFPSTMPVGMTVKADATGMVKQFYVPEDVVKAIGSYKTTLQEAAKQTGHTGHTGHTLEESEMQEMQQADQ